MTPRAFKQVDVFTRQLGFGNPLAVVLDGEGLDDVCMQRFARWTNLSETCFLMPPTEPAADYRVRIFTPDGELPFAGHPTLGSCHAWLSTGARPRRAGLVVQQGVTGLVPIRIDPTLPGRLAFAAPPSQRSDPAPAVLAQVARALGVKPQEVRSAQLLNNGPVWLALLLDSASTVLALEPDHAQLKKIGLKVGVAHIQHAQPAIYSGASAGIFDGGSDPNPVMTVRAFAAPIGVPEDPVTGSLAASLAQWLIGAGTAPSHYTVHQGECIGRAGRIHVAHERASAHAHAHAAESTVPGPSLASANGVTWIGGDVVDCIDGFVTL